MIYDNLIVIHMLQEMVFPAVRYQPGPGLSVQDQVQQSPGADGDSEGSQSDHSESREAEDWAEQGDCDQ